jgi:hypothetical protein
MHTLKNTYIVLILFQSKGNSETEKNDDRLTVSMHQSMVKA